MEINNPDKVSFETTRLIIRPYQIIDASSVSILYINNSARLTNILENWNYSIINDNSAREYINKMIIGWKLRTIFTFGIWYKGTGDLIGETKIFHVNWNDFVCEMGIFLDYQYEGKFYHLDINKKMLDYSFNVLNMKHIIGVCDVKNTISHFFLKRLNAIVIASNSQYITYIFNRQKYYNND